MLMSDNAVLASYIDDFAQRIGRYIRIGLSSESRRRHSLNTWSQLIAAVINGQGEEAAMLHRLLALNNRSAALEEFSRRQSDSSQTISEPS
jgi:DNA-binding GntR family transcriptional regulator